MDSTHISDGEQLRLAILDYTKSKIEERKQLLAVSLLPPFIAYILFSLEIWQIFAGILSVASFFTIILAIMVTFFDSLEAYSTYRHLQVVRLLKESICQFSIDTSNSFVIIEFFVPAKHLTNKNSEVGALIIEIYDRCMPLYSSKNFSIYFELYTMPSISIQPENSIMDELERLVDSDLDRNSSGLPSDIRAKGKEMSRAYLMLYCIENTLRLFIESEGKKIRSPLTITSSVRSKIAGRKTNETQNKYLSVRGTSDLFYMDFKELGDVIVNNPELLSQFPSENWVRVKIEELGNIRNLIAHNSYIGEHELKIIATNYESILRQIRK